MRSAIAGFSAALLVAGCLTEYEVVTGTGGASSRPETDASAAATESASASESGGTGCSECGGECVDLTQDPRHCGECDRDCDADEQCVAGQCQEACAGGCAGAELCAGATCVCKPGLSACDGVCVDLESNPAHCGACGQTCEGAPCGDAQCLPGGCGPELELCGGACVELASDVEHCGACDSACQTDELCVEGQCRDVTVGSCATCPCGDCDDEGRCCEFETLPTILCVKADECP